VKHQPESTVRVSKSQTVQSMKRNHIGCHFQKLKQALVDSLHAVARVKTARWHVTSLFSASHTQRSLVPFVLGNQLYINHRNQSNLRRLKLNSRTHFSRNRLVSWSFWDRTCVNQHRGEINNLLKYCPVSSGETAYFIVGIGSGSRYVPNEFQS